MAESLQQLLEQKERDLELAAQYGTALLDENKQLKEKMKELKERLASMEMEGSYEMKEQIQLLEESNKLMKSKLTILESKNGDLEAKIILKNAQKEDLAQTIDELTRKHKNAEDRIAMLQKELENNSTAGTIYDLNEQLEMQKEVIQDLRVKHAETQRVNTELTKKLDDATKKIDQLNSKQVSNEIDPALLEELKELRQSNAQFKREIKEKDEIISELQTRPAEPRPTVYQRTIIEVPVGGGATTERNTTTTQPFPAMTQNESVARTDSHQEHDTRDPQHTNASAAVPNHRSETTSEDHSNDSGHATNTDYHAAVHANNDTPTASQSSSGILTHTATAAPRTDISGATQSFSDTFMPVATIAPKADIATQGLSDTWTPTTITASRVDINSDSDSAVDGSSDEFNATYAAKSNDEHISEATPNGQMRSDPVAIQQSTEGDQGETKKTEKTPLSSPRALYRDPRVQDLAAKLAESERQLSIKSEEVHRLSLKLAELAERASQVAPQTTIINQVIPPKKEGFLVKQGARVKSWKRRFFFIESDFLYYSESQKSRFVTLGMIRLDRAEVDQAIIPNRTNVIAVKTADRTYYLCADTEEDMHEWLRVLKEKVEEIAEKKRNEK